MDNAPNPRPPQWSLRLLRLFIRKDYLEEIEGDMEEVFMDELEQFSARKARWRYIVQIFKLLKPNLTRLFNSQKFNYLGMFKHNLLVTFRGFKRHKLTFFINLIGLSTGLAASLLIYLWVNDERSVDAFHENNDRLHWVYTHFELPTNTVTWNYTSGKMASQMKADFPEVEDAVRVGNHFFRPKGVISFAEQNFETQGLYASANFFDVLSYKLIMGNGKDALADKGSVVISQSLAIKMFGTIDKAMDQTVNWENSMFNKDLIVKGIFQDPPSNSTEQFEAIVNYNLLIEIDQWANEWNGGYARTYLLMKEGTDMEAFNAKIEDYMNIEERSTGRFSVFTQPYAKSYLFGDYQNGVLTGGRIQDVRLFTYVGIFILLIACINFMNLSTAQASKKMKEIGVKKAIGAHRQALIFQFLSESVILAFISLGVAIAAVNLVLPQFNYITNKSLVFDLGGNIPILCLIVFTTGLLSGSYPALYLSGFNPVAVLKGKVSNLKGEQWIRKGLVIVQFTLSIVFIIGVMIINQQIEFTQNTKLGYDRENVLTFSRKGTDTGDPLPMLTALNKIPGVISTGNMAGDFLWGNDNGSGYSWEDGKDDDNYLFKSPKIGYDVIETLDIQLIAGRSFDRRFNDTRDRIIINEAAVELMGLNNPIGTNLDDSGRKTEIIGVVRDFQYGSLHQKIEPMVIRFRDWGRDFMVKIQAGTEQATLLQIEEVYKEFHPKYDFEPSFLSDNYSALYDSESKVASLSNYMAGIAIIISCLGLFGLATFTAERRTKEIGIRKILGASKLSIMKILTGSFTGTVVISIVLAIPLGYIAATSWLQNFAYSIELEWWIFGLAGATALIIAWLTVGAQTFKASSVNPVECLRNE